MSARSVKMLGGAISFFLAGQRCQVTLQFGSYRPHTAIGPAVVCYAFALELALKLLIEQKTADQKKPRGHNLETLYRGLPEEIQNIIWSNMKKFRSKTDFFHYMSMTTGSNGRSIFENWRYSYEAPSQIVMISFLVELFDSILRTIKAEAPAVWEEFKEAKGDFSPSQGWNEFLVGKIIAVDDET